MCQAREHKISALIPVFLDSSQTVTQLTAQQAVGGGNLVQAPQKTDPIPLFHFSPTAQR